MIIYDCEIEKAIPADGKDRIDGIEYCEGWSDFKGMGISVICSYNYATDCFETFTKENFWDFQALVDRTDIVVGFNSFAFDILLCKAHDIDIPKGRSWDLQVEIWKAAGLSPSFNRNTHGGLGLGACVSINCQKEFKISSELIPMLWQQGEKDRVIEHCRDDVEGVRELIAKIRQDGYIKDPRNPDRDLYIHPPYVMPGAGEHAGRMEHKRSHNGSSDLDNDYDVILGCLGLPDSNLL